MSLNDPYKDLPQYVLVELLRDSQDSLATALGRIELHRVRERKLVQELAELRKALYGNKSNVSAMANSRAPDASLAPDARHNNIGNYAPESTSQGHSPAESDAALPTITVPSIPSARFTSTADDSKPLYVTSLEEGEHAVMLHQGSEKIGCSLIVAKDFIDFVELHGRVHRDNFVGISSSKDRPPMASSQAFSFSAMARASFGFGSASLSRTQSDSSLSDTAAEASADAAATSTSSNTQRLQEQQQQQQQQQPLCAWEVHVRPGPTGIHSIKFSASQSTRATLHKHTEKWLGVPPDISQTSLPLPLLPKPSPLVLLAEPSYVMSHEAQLALAAAVPPLELLRPWRCSYSSFTHGVSLSTLYRRMRSGVPAITVVQDTGGYVFGCYTSEGWHISPRYYGSGECFVFQLEPHRCMWRWRVTSHTKNDFFMLSTPDCLALGSLGHFALHIDQELLHGSSDTCGTFGSPCLASKEDFKCRAVEVWQPQT